MILVGDEPYYRRFGFTRDAARALDYPPPTNPDRLLARALAPGAFDGVAGMVRRWTRGSGRLMRRPRRQPSCNMVNGKSRAGYASLPAGSRT